MASRLSESFQILYLDREEPRRPLFSPPVDRTATPQSFLNQPDTPPSRYAIPAVLRSPSNASSQSSATSLTNSGNSFGRKGSTSTRASSISVPTNWQPPPTFQQFVATQPINYGFDLPCEFFFLGCNLRFTPPQIDEWISHSASHFADAPLPSTTICTFCDEAKFRSQGDAEATWVERMQHVYDHLAAFISSESMRPDFWIIEHMNTYGLISSEDHAHAEKGTERLYCDHTHSLDYVPPEILKKEEKRLEQRHNLRNEERQRRIEGQKSKGTHKSSYSHRSPKVHNIRNK